ncbi:MAG: hypothetical protein Q8K60_06930 [Parachlamydiaceae bacterium]|nr:hypothetical protein [Parachlamydiaceae bacterium]
MFLAVGPFALAGGAVGTTISGTCARVIHNFTKIPSPKKNDPDVVIARRNENLSEKAARMASVISIISGYGLALGGGFYIGAKLSLDFVFSNITDLGQALEVLMPKNVFSNINKIKFVFILSLGLIFISAKLSKFGNKTVNAYLNLPDVKNAAKARELELQETIQKNLEEQKNAIEEQNNKINLENERFNELMNKANIID